MPSFHPEKWIGRDGGWAHFPRAAAHIGVAFTGDMFGDFNLDVIGEKAWEMAIKEILRCVDSRSNQRHRFYFLTKAPQNLARFNPWPQNALVGLSLTGAESTRQEHEKLALLSDVQGGRIWLSYEPVLGWLTLDWPELAWLVIGAQSGAGAVKPERGWIKSVEEVAERRGVPIWRKNNLVKALKIEPREERP